MGLSFKKLVFPIDSSIKTPWNNSENADLFDGDNLVLYLNPGEYRPVFSLDAEAIAGFSSFVVKQGTPALSGFEVETQENRIAVYYILKTLEANAYGTGTYTPIPCLDYLLPDVADVATGYSSRNGLLQTEIQSGTIGDRLGTTERDRYGFGIRLTYTIFR